MVRYWPRAEVLGMPECFKLPGSATYTADLTSDGGRGCNPECPREQNLSQPPTGRQSLLWGRDNKVPEEWPLGTG